MQVVYAVKDGAVIGDRKLRVAVIGGGPSGACAAESLAKGGVEAFLIERKLDNCKVRTAVQLISIVCWSTRPSPRELATEQKWKF